MAKTVKKTEITKQPAVPEGTIVVNNMPIVLRNVDRTLARDVGSWWDTLQQAEKVIYPNRTRIYDLYKTIEIDTHLKGLVRKRIVNVTNKKIYFERDGKKDDSLDALIDTPAFKAMIKELMLQKFWGITGLEFLPGPELDFKKIPRKHLKPEKKIITKEQNDYTGFSYEGVWNIWVVGDADDLGEYLECCPLAIWKKGNWGDWAQYIEIFGQPFVVGKYNGFDEKTRNELDTVMRNFGGSNRMMIPNEAGIDVLDGKTNNGTGDLQDTFRKACNDEMSVRIAGATEQTTSSKTSGYAQSKEHGKQHDEISKDDLIDIYFLLNVPHFKTIATSYGFNVERGRFRFEEEIDMERVRERVAIALSLKKGKIPVDDDYLYEITGIPKPENYDELKEEEEEIRKHLIGEEEDLDDDDETDSDDTNNPDDTGTGEKAKKKKKGKKAHDVNAVLKGMTLWERFKALF